MLIVRKFKQFMNLIMSCFIIDSCLLCAQPSDNDLSLCSVCNKNLPRLSQKNIKNNHSIKISPKYWDDLYVFFHYEKGIKKLIQSFKFGKNQISGNILKHIFYTQLFKHIALKSQFDVIIPMPIHQRRNLTRGFNQAYILAQHISSQCGIPIDSSYVFRDIHTKFQNKLSTSGRQENILNVFKLSKTQRYQHVLIVDDITTTGSSLNELAKTLKYGGVKKITACSIAISQG